MYTSRLILSLINFIFGLIEVILLVRIILELFAANPATPFVAWIYDLSSSLLYPFRGIFPSPTLRGGFVLDISAIVALLAYALIAYFITEIIRYISYRSMYYDEEDAKRR